jgi:DNA-binding transcriptional ArsR family regulator
VLGHGAAQGTKEATLSIHETVIDQRLVKALSHPLRMKLLMMLNQMVASPIELARELDESLGTVSYHIRSLADLGCIELVRTEPRRGAVEHYYRAIARPEFSDRDWVQLPPSVRRSISGAVLSQIWKDTARAVEEDTFDSRPERHLSRTPLVLDQQGWDDLAEVLIETVERAMEIEAESAQRLQEAGEEGSASKLVVMHHESPPPDGAAARR